MRRSSEPMLNVPPVVTATLLALGLIHAVRVFLLSPRANTDVLLLFAFIPARYDPVVVAQGVPGGIGAQVWTFVSYALIHGDLTHLGVNAVWFLAFGSAVARRFGPLRFVVFFAVTAAAGAAMHLAAHFGEFVPMVGASAAISGCMAAAIRFAFQHGGPLGLWRAHEAHAYHVPAAPLRHALMDARILAFLLVWFGLNLLLGLGSLSLAGEEQEIAWQAHIGGFLAGLLLFPWFDPVGSADDVGAGRGSDTAASPD
ncbi:MAG: rhomboid family intramembrane serine protease [Xanthobacteraceae bacterium]